MPAAADILKHRYPKVTKLDITKVDYNTVKTVHILANDQWWQFSYTRAGDTYIDISTLEFVEETGCEMWVHMETARCRSMAQHDEIEEVGLEYLNWYYSGDYLRGDDYPGSL